MNRNRMYEYLEEIGMYSIFVSHGQNYKGRRKYYHTEFRPNREMHKDRFTIVTDWGYIRGCSSIHLCMRELVVESDFGHCKINMFYKNIEKFEVRLEDIDE